MKHKGNLLIVEDEGGLREALTEILGHAGYHVTPAANAMAAREAMDMLKFDLAVLDVRLPDGNGIELLREFTEQDPHLTVIIITAYAEIDTAVEAMRLGAADFLKKPFDPDELLVRVEETLKKRRLLLECEALQQQVEAGRLERDLIGQCPAMQQVMKTIKLVADSDSTVLITGESGTGKEVVARCLHRASRRAKKPMVSINCGAIPEELLESELFGHVKGAFTGAFRARAGRFEVADGGTIFLDEIGDMSPKLQVKLLRVLQERCFEPVGSHQSIHVDVRVIAATHRDLEAEIRAGRFREDLYYRLNVIPLHLPPLRERGEDILLLADYFMRRFNKEKGAKLAGFDEQARKVMLSYDWPGNVRQLSNLMERLATIKRQGIITVNDLPANMLSPEQRLTRDFTIDVGAVESIDFKSLVEEFENHLLISALQRFNWNKNRAANFLSMNRTTLVEKLKKKGLKPPAS